MSLSPRDSRTSRNLFNSGFVAVIFLAAAGIWFAYQVAVSLSMPLYGDEITKVVAAGMILEGGRLYDDIFHHHSPLIFAFVQPIAAVFGTSSLVPFRLASALLLLISAGAIGWSPLLYGWRSRCLAVGLFLVTAGALYNGVSLFRLIYQPVTGYFVVIFLALFALPLLAATRPTRWQSAAAGLAAGLAIGTNTGAAGSIIVIGILALSVALFRDRATPVHRATDLRHAFPPASLSARRTSAGQWSLPSFCPGRPHTNGRRAQAAQSVSARTCGGPGRRSSSSMAAVSRGGGSLSLRHASCRSLMASIDSIRSGGECSSAATLPEERALERNDTRPRLVKPWYVRAILAPYIVDIAAKLTQCR